ncbi:DUF1491 family protein [Zavarzinia compransoris]|uniref:DUF1491 domain-containing protein n=1 Tax=Zavarzinia compransoris TaxID=1264899 RepID=A0A317E4Y3_9PROT|nr:DUF1491 family protein [Zavarzinia compransoris]PWR22049.1 DUF1491 domain-containing protein [Zavarzinia compransoris]TDP47210.1 hypothetical protein DES42_103382 [Zavarzinia compransoris]
MTDVPRLKSRLVVQALIRRAEVAGLSALVMRKGDEDAGGIMLVVDRFAAGSRLFDRVRDGAGRLVWAAADGGAPLDPPALAERLERAARRDPDLWLVAVEDPRGLFDPLAAD